MDKFILSFTHDTQWDYLLPGIPPTGKRVELPHVVVMKFENLACNCRRNPGFGDPRQREPLALRQGVRRTPGEGCHLRVYKGPPAGLQVTTGR